MNTSSPPDRLVLLWDASQQQPQDFTRTTKTFVQNNENQALRFCGELCPEGCARLWHYLNNVPFSPSTHPMVAVEQDGKALHLVSLIRSREADGNPFFFGVDLPPDSVDSDFTFKGVSGNFQDEDPFGEVVFGQVVAKTHGSDETSPQCACVAVEEMGENGARVHHPLHGYTPVDEKCLRRPCDTNVNSLSGSRCDVNAYCWHR